MSCGTSTCSPPRRPTLLKVKKSWLYDEVERGALNAIRLGKQLRFRASDLARYLDGNRR
jgi:excisionase family DNA binding protein